MKLIVCDALSEGQITRDDAVFVFGRNTMGGTGKVNGWYFIANLTFIRKTVDNYMDRLTWRPRQAHCYLRWNLVCSKAAGHDQCTMRVYKAWDEIQHNK